MDGFLPHHARRLELEIVVADALDVLTRKPSLLPLRQAIVANEEFLSRLGGRWTSGFCHADAWLGNALLANGRVTFFDFRKLRDWPADIRSFHAAMVAMAAEALRREAIVREYAQRLSQPAKALARADLELLPRMAALNDVRVVHSLRSHDLLSDELWESYQQRTLAEF